MYLNPSRSTTTVLVTVAGRTPGDPTAAHSQTVTLFYQSYNLEADDTIDGPGGNGQRGIKRDTAGESVCRKGHRRNKQRHFWGKQFHLTPMWAHYSLILTSGLNLILRKKTSGSPTDGYDPLFVKTDSGGEAKVYLKLNDDNQTTAESHTVTATFKGIPRTFTATAPLYNRNADSQGRHRELRSATERRTADDCFKTLSGARAGWWRERISGSKLSGLQRRLAT